MICRGSRSTIPLKIMPAQISGGRFFASGAPTLNGMDRAARLDLTPRKDTGFDASAAAGQSRRPVKRQGAATVKLRPQLSHGDDVMPLDVVAGYEAWPGAMVTTVRPPAVLRTPAWMAAVQTDESSEYTPAPQMVEDVQLAGQLTRYVRPGSPARVCAF